MIIVINTAARVTLPSNLDPAPQLRSSDVLVCSALSDTSPQPPRDLSGSNIR
jgi:hypothetical protein